MGVAIVAVHAGIAFAQGKVAGPRRQPGPDGSIFDGTVSERMLAALLDFGITILRSPATPTIAGLRLRDDLNAGRVRGARDGVAPHRDG